MYETQSLINEGQQQSKNGVQDFIEISGFPWDFKISQRFQDLTSLGVARLSSHRRLEIISAALRESGIVHSAQMKRFPLQLELLIGHVTS